MARNWGRSDHEPGGDPSWLGGKDRGQDAQGSSGWSSDFSSQSSREASSDFASEPSAQADPRAQEAESMAPRFGERGEDADSPQSTQWHSDFGTPGQESGAGGGRSPRSTKAQVTGLLGSIVGLVIFAFLAYRAGMDMWWVLLVIGVPLINRGTRALRRNRRD